MKSVVISLMYEEYVISLSKTTNMVPTPLVLYIVCICGVLTVSCENIGQRQITQHNPYVHTAQDFVWCPMENQNYIRYSKGRRNIKKYRVARYRHSCLYSRNTTRPLIVSETNRNTTVVYYNCSKNVPKPI